MEGDKGNLTITNFVAYCIIVLIGLYLVASTIVSFIPLPHQTFTIFFTVSGGIPALALLFNEKYVNRKAID